ncbi:Laccase-7 [Camellia lanceoleosa]|uniref:Laccase-7 n=1 Tax=Camellia lanceoleosa TaxID=1840588 RepID=A0ACC0HT42_9ERIC|nr:Laccase-7 [Camellia lanceoleosa]
MALARPLFLLACAFAFLASSLSSAAVVEHTFYVQNLTVQLLCHRRVITAVNGSLPGPIIQVHEGDVLIVHVFNKHGIFQLLSGWADGPEYATQCPILPGNSYTYRFAITGQEGTLWWHAHVQWLRATVHGALIIRPRVGHSYPFPNPQKEFPILLGEWWNANVIDVENQGLASGSAPNISDAFTINGRPGNQYPCSSNRTYKIEVVKGKTYLLRIINAALNNQLFFKIANHNMTVVAVDASYTVPIVSGVVVITGQTTAFSSVDQPPTSYSIAAHVYASAAGVPFDSTTTTGIIIYENATLSTPQMPVLPAFNGTPTAHKFSSNLIGLVDGPHWTPVPLEIDEQMFVTVGLGLVACGGTANATCAGPFQQRLGASMNNASFQFPTKLSMLQAFFNNVDGIYTLTFQINHHWCLTTQIQYDFNGSIIMTTKSTKVKQVKFNSTIDCDHEPDLGWYREPPIHLHGFNFHVLAQGFGNYDPISDPKSSTSSIANRNTIGVPVEVEFINSNKQSG